MNDEKPIWNLMKGREWSLFVICVVLAFTLGAWFEQAHINKYWKNIMHQRDLEFSKAIKKYNFSLVSYSPVATNETLPLPFACVLANGNETSRMYYNLLVPAVNNIPVCFVSNYDYGGKNESV